MPDATPVLLTSEDNPELAIPGRRAGFGVVKMAQAEGDFRVLDERNRRVLCVHLNGDLMAALHTLTEQITVARAD